MTRFLFVVPPMVGHVNPTIPVGRQLAARGHEVAWTGPNAVLPDVLPRDARFLPLPVSDEVREHIRRRIDDVRGLQAVRHLVTEVILPLAESMLPGVRAAVDAFRPDALVVDQQTLAGMAVAEARGLPWATSASTSATLHDALEMLPNVKEWADGLQRDFLRRAGVGSTAAATLDLRFSRHLVLVFSTEALVGPGPYPDHYVFAGPAIGDRGRNAPFDWDWLDHDGRSVLVSLGTVNWHNGGPFFTAAARALGDLASRGVRGVMVAPPELVPDAPPNVLVTPEVPQLALLPRIDAVVCHGGHNTVCEALAHGLPLVIAPIRDDQPVVADQVVRAGAGLRVKYRRASADGLRRAIEAALSDPGLRAGARRVQASFSAAGGPAAAADHLESLPVLVSR